MTLNVIWLDTTTERRKFLEETFGNGGDWFNSHVLTVENATHVVAHWTDLQEQWDSLRVKQLIEALRQIVSRKNASPSVVVYSGKTDEPDNVKSIQKWIGLFLKDVPSVTYRLGIDRYGTDVEKLSRFLQAATNFEFEASERILVAERDVALAIDLVAETVAWLNVTQNRPTEMEALRTQLADCVGESGEKIVNTLSSMVGYDVKDRVSQEVLKKEVKRIEAWTNVGIISSIKDSKPC